MRGSARFLATTVLAPLFLLLAGCAETPEQAAETSLECEISGRYYFVSHPWACLREGGRVIEVSAEPSPWVNQAVKVNWQGRDDIKSGRLSYNRAGGVGEILLALPEAGDRCQGPYRLHAFGDAQWLAACDSGQRIRGTVFMNEGGVSVSGIGKDGEGRLVGFYPQAGAG